MSVLSWSLTYSSMLLSEHTACCVLSRETLACLRIYCSVLVHAAGAALLHRTQSWVADAWQSSCLKLGSQLANSQVTCLGRTKFVYLLTQCILVICVRTTLCCKNYYFFITYSWVFQPKANNYIVNRLGSRCEWQACLRQVFLSLLHITISHQAKSKDVIKASCQWEHKIFE